MKEEEKKNGLFEALLKLESAGEDAYKNVRSRFFIIMITLFPLIIFEWVMNYFGFLAVNAVIYFILFVLTMYVWSHPKVVIGMAVLEKANKEKFAAYLAYVILWLSIVSMFLATLPFGWYLSFREAFGLFLIGMVFLSAIGWMAFHGWFKTTIYKKVITRYAVIGFLVCVWILIPASFKYWATGIDFYGSAGTSETAKAFAKAKRSMSIKEDETNARALKAVTDRIKENGKVDLTKDEKKLWEKLEKDNLPNKLSDAFSKISWSTSAEAKTKAEEPSRASANVSATSVASGENWKLCWKKPQGYQGVSQTKSRCDAVKIGFLEQGFRLEIMGSMFSIAGERVGENAYQGKYTNIAGEEGLVFLKFSPDFATATGWQKEPASQVEIYTWLTK
jgi:hypothetical protein